MKLPINIINTFKQLRKVILLFPFLVFSILVFGQQKDIADKLVAEGVALQDKGEVDSAIAKYHQALDLDKDNLFALAEMCYSYLSIQKFDDAVNFSERALKIHPGDPVLKTVYVSYGNALDGLGKPDKSIEIYDKGIKLFPDYFQLYYNKGISQNELHETDDALISFERSASLNPDHASSDNAIGLLLFNINKIPSLLAFCRFLILEPGSKRAVANLDNLRKIVDAHVTKTGEKNVTVSISHEMFAAKKKKQADDFSSAELMLSLSSALDYDAANIDKTEVEKFIRKFTSLCGFLTERKKDNTGFCWDYYVPYFTEMNNKGFLTTFAYIAYTTSKKPDVTDWLNTHKTEIDDFYKWSGEFKWCRK